MREDGLREGARARGARERERTSAATPAPFLFCFLGSTAVRFIIKIHPHILVFSIVAPTQVHTHICNSLVSERAVCGRRRGQQQRQRAARARRRFVAPPKNGRPSFSLLSADKATLFLLHQPCSKQLLHQHAPRERHREIQTRTQTGERASPPPPLHETLPPTLPSPSRSSCAPALSPDRACAAAGPIAAGAARACPRRHSRERERRLLARPRERGREADTPLLLQTDRPEN